MKLIVLLAALACQPPATAVAWEPVSEDGRALPSPDKKIPWDHRVEDATMFLGPDRRRDFSDEHWALTITSTADEQANPRPPRPTAVIAAAALGLVGLLAFLGLAAYATLRERETAGPAVIMRTTGAVPAAKRTGSAASGHSGTVG